MGIILKWKLEIVWESVDWSNLAEDTYICQAVVKASWNFGFRRVHKIAKSDYEVRHVCPSVRPSVRLEPLGSKWMIFNKFDVWGLFENLSRIFKFDYNLTRGTVLYMKTDVHLLYLAELFLEWNIFLDKICRENQNTYCVFNFFFFFRKSRHLRDTVEKYSKTRWATPQMTIKYSAEKCEHTETRSECLILIAFPR